MRMLNNPEWKPQEKQKPQPILNKDAKMNLYLPNDFNISKALEVLDKAQCFSYNVIYTEDSTKQYTYEFLDKKSS